MANDEFYTMVASTLRNQSPAPTRPAFLAKKMILPLLLVISIFIGSVVANGGCDGLHDMFEGQWIGYTPDEWIGSSKSLMPFYLSFLIAIGSAMFEFRMFGPPDMSRLMKEKSPENESSCPFLRQAIRQAQQTFTQILQMLSLSATVLNVMSLWVVLWGACQEQFQQEGNIFARMMTALELSLLRFSLSPYLSDWCKFTGLWNMMMYNMKFVRYHDRDRDFHITEDEQTFEPWYTAPGMTPGDSRLNGAFLGWLFNPQGLITCSGPIVAVSAAVVISPYVPGPTWFLAGLALFEICIYCWVFIPALMLWFLFLDNICMPLLALVFQVKTSNAKVEFPVMYNSRAKFLSIPEDREKALECIMKPNHRCEWLLGLGRGKGSTISWWTLVGAQVPRITWTSPNWKMSPRHAYEMDVTWLKCIGITYHGMCLFLTISVLLPTVIQIVLISASRFLSGPLSFSGYVGALAQTLSERHWYTFAETLQMKSANMIDKANEFHQDMASSDPTGWALIVRRFV